MRNPQIDPRPGDKCRDRVVGAVKYRYELLVGGGVDPETVYVYRVRYRAPGSKRARWVPIREWRRWAGVTVGALS